MHQDAAPGAPGETYQSPVGNASPGRRVAGHLAGLSARGLNPERRYLFVLDGSKALRAAVDKVFGDRAEVQRCQIHKRHNVHDHLPEGCRADYDRQLRNAYARLARLPRPKLAPLDIASWVHQVARLETRLPVRIEPGPNVTVQADRDQLEQLLINLLRNAVDAALETSGSVSLGWLVDANALELWVEDEGLGISNTANLFVPFFTTKPGGSGIGLVLCRQIAEAHGGSVTLENRKDAHGCRACVRLPVDARAQTPWVSEFALRSWK